jgi:predicted enzyme related to lactoylglutathione lyase
MNTTTAHQRIDYIEFACRDIAAAKTFYAAAFGWQFTDYGPDYTSFHDGRLAGGFFRAADAPAQSNPLVVIFARDLEAAAEAVTRAGGQIVKPAFEFPGGRRFEFRDPAGLLLAVWSDKRADGSAIA